MRRHSTATLMGMTKKELVEYVRIAEHNQEVAEEALNRQAENVKDWMPVRHGEWVDRYGNKYANHLYECSVCGEKALWRFEVNALGNEIEVQDLSDFCPGCGARMDAPDTNVGNKGGDSHD